MDLLPTVWLHSSVGSSLYRNRRGRRPGYPVGATLIFQVFLRDYCFNVHSKNSEAHFSLPSAPRNSEVHISFEGDFVLDLRTAFPHRISQIIQYNTIQYNTIHT